MLNAYIIAPKDLVLRTDSLPTPHPLAFSASQLDTATGLPCGLTALDGHVYVGSPEELPVFVRYSDGHVDILDKPDPESVAYGDFVVSGTAILVSQSLPRSTADARIRSRDEVKRVAVGILEDGNVFVVFCTATVDKLKAMLCAYGVSAALLLASDNVYFNNPRSGIFHGEQPVLSLQATYYEELPSPILVIDPAHGGSDTGNVSAGLYEKDLTLNIATDMVSYLKDTYYGTFLSTRTDDSLIPLASKTRFVQDIQADFLYGLHINALDGITRGFECQCYSNASESVKAQTADLHLRLAHILDSIDIHDNGLYPKSSPMFESCPCPYFVAKVLYMDNAKDMNMLSRPETLHTLAVAQAEAIAQSLGLNKRTGTSKLSRCATDKRYRVNVGEFPLKLGALEMCETLRKLGFDAYITR